MPPTGEKPDALLRARLESSYPAWAARLRLETGAHGEALVLEVPGHPGHRLSIEISQSEAMVAYSDGSPPGPAEKLFVWPDEPVSVGVEAVCRFIESLVQGQVVLVRARLPRLTGLLRRDSAKSLLSFVSAESLASWPPRRRRGIVRSWKWTPDGTS